MVPTSYMSFVYYICYIYTCTLAEIFPSSAISINSENGIEIFPNLPQLLVKTLLLFSFITNLLIKNLAILKVQKTY